MQPPKALRRIVASIHSRFGFGDREIEGSDLFDASWYVNQFPGQRIEKPVRHYLNVGWKRGLDPGPHFNSKSYLDRYPDVAESGLNPLLHYLRYGKAEGRTAVPLQDGRIIWPEPRIPAVRTLRLGVVVHAYYQDLLPELFDAIAKIEGNFRLYVAIPSDQSRPGVESLATRFRDRGPLQIRISPNVGRNVSTLTALFGEQMLEECDIILHLHTKKSLHYGEERSHWRRSLINSLVGADGLPSRVLDLFETDPALGVVSPAPFFQVPITAYSVGNNASQMERLSTILEIPKPHAEIFDFPVGCMFWARTDAIRQLLDGRLGFDAYPPEEGQVDGTIAHAVERIMIHLARTNGYSFIEVESDGCSYRRNAGSLNWEQYEAIANSPAVERVIRESDVISFDVFDTLITRRPVDRQELFRAIEDEADAALMRQTGFAECRGRAETTLQAQRPWSFNYEDIYEEIASSDPELAQFARVREFQIELEEVIPRQKVVELARLAKRLGKQVNLISDDYFTREQTERLLERAGAAKLGTLYLSNESGMAKTDGAMFRHLQSLPGNRDSKFVHFGDDPLADVSVPASMDIKAIPLFSPKTLFQIHHRTLGAAEPQEGASLSLTYNDPLEGR